MPKKWKNILHANALLHIHIQLSLFVGVIC